MNFLSLLLLTLSLKLFCFTHIVLTQDACSSRNCNKGFCIVYSGKAHCVCSGTSYAGEDCENAVNYCVTLQSSQNITSLPVCLNNGSCSPNYNQKPFFNCSCQPGYEGSRCEIDIDECAAKPCNHGNCTDKVNGYHCDCQKGWEGHNCSINIDECASKPCLNGGHCVDKIAEYYCNCSNTGFTGQNCSINIDDCSPNPCQNNATCSDLVKDFNCSCHDGYSDKTCSTDINECETIKPNCYNNGTCLQRSIQSYYIQSNYKNIYPFNQTFSYKNAANFSCNCLPGSYGNHCEINPNDCFVTSTSNTTSSTSKCIHSTNCTDLLNDYQCHCQPGYSGKNCSIEINECDQFKPCQNSAKCVDKVNDYLCECSNNLGGKNCSISLTGCTGISCFNSAVCKPILQSEYPTTQHDFICQCLNGTTGRFCNISTLLSFNSSTEIQFLQPRNISFIQLQLKTTLNNFQILKIRSSNFYFLLEVKNKILQTQISINNSLDNLKTVEMESLETYLQANNSNWITIKLDNSTSSFLNSLFVFGTTKTNNLEENRTVILSSFTGCFQDFKFGENFILTENIKNDKLNSFISATNILFNSCPRSQQCLPNTCVLNQFIDCIDLWDNFKCNCQQKYGGKRCEINLPNYIFGYNNSISILEFNITDFSLNFKLNFNLETRSVNEFVFFIGQNSKNSSEISSNNINLVSFINGKGFLVLKCVNGTSSSVIGELISTTSVVHGQSLSIEISLDKTVLMVKIGLESLSLNLTAFFGNYKPEILVFGGFKEVLKPNFVLPRVKRDLSLSGVSYLNANLAGFKGVLGGLKLGDVPLLVSPVLGLDSSVVASFSTGVFNDSTFPTDPLCSNILNLCQNGATCSNKYLNDYTCLCTKGYRGKNCSNIDHCSFSTTCPLNTTCSNLEPSGFECTGIANFGFKSQKTSNEIVIESSLPSFELNYLTITFRTRLLNAEILNISSKTSLNSQFLVQINNGLIEIYVNNKLFLLLSGLNVSNADWITLNVNMIVNSLINVTVFGAGTLSKDFRSLSILSTGVSIFGDSRISLASNFKGCMKNVKLNSFGVPLFGYSLQGTSGFTKILGVDPVLGNNCLGDDVCDPSPCLNNGKCVDQWNKYNCTCQGSFYGDKCEFCPGNVCLNTAGVSTGVIIAICVVILIILLIIIIVLLYQSVKRRRSETGLYKPSSEENRQHHLANFNGVKPPPTERLI